MIIDESEIVSRLEAYHEILRLREKDQKGIKTKERKKSYEEENII